jgi:hypothetical protein
MAWEADSGAIDRETFLKVVKRHGVDVSPDPDKPGHTLFMKDDMLDSRVLHEWIDRDILRFFSRTCAIPMASFFNSHRLIELRKKTS